MAGTRPEAIKLAPVVLELQTAPEFSTIVCVTAQHRELLDQSLAIFGIVPDVDLGLMRPGQSADSFLACAIPALTRTMMQQEPAMVIVQGDTATALAAAQAASRLSIPVAHVEAGLRSGDLSSPFPEEMYRRTITRLTSLHFAPTSSARDALLAEDIPRADVYLTGNSGIDALRFVVERIRSDQNLAATLDSRLRSIDLNLPLVLVTAHRRESFGAPLVGIAAAIRTIAGLHEVQFVIPVHPNPSVRSTFEMCLRDVPNVRLIGALDYLMFVRLLSRAQLVLTDSGGIQEEAPALGVPVVVMRNTTERFEGIATGNAILTGTDPQAITAAVDRLLCDHTARGAMAKVCFPYGDGHASSRIATAIRNRLSKAAFQETSAIAPEFA